MPNLFALCGDKDNLTVKLVPMTNPIQNQVYGMFLQQEAAFRSGCRETEFHENWKPDGNEIMTVPIPTGGLVLTQISETLGTSHERPSVGEIEAEGIRALATTVSAQGADRVLVQLFERSQVLNTGNAFFLISGTFGRLDESAFRIANKLTCIVENGQVKFKSLHQLSKIIDTTDIYHEASDAELETFAGHELFDVSDVETFKSATNSRARGYLHSVLKDNLLDDQTADSLQHEAMLTELEIAVHEGKVVVPEQSSKITELAQFLNSGRYRSPISNQARIANSHRPAPRSTS